jgi:tetrahydromethanopterin S-methyltransferase subunit A
MTTKEATNLAIAMNDISSIKDDIKEIKELLKTQDDKYISRLEGKVAGVIVGLALTAITVFFQIKDHLK